MQAILISSNKRLALQSLKCSQHTLNQHRLFSKINNSKQAQSSHSDKSNSRSKLFTNSLVAFSTLLIAYKAQSYTFSHADGEQVEQNNDQTQEQQQSQAQTQDEEQVQAQNEVVVAVDSTKDAKEVNEAVENKEQQEEEEKESSGSIMKELKGSNIGQVIANKDNKFIFFYRSSKLTQDEFQKVEEHASKMYNGLRILPYKIDLDTQFDELSSYLKQRNPATEAQVDKQIEENSFLLANQYGDIWFWEFDLIRYFFGDLLEQIFNFYQGPLKLMSPEQIIMNSSSDNDYHVVAYIDDYKNEESMKKMKNFRKFHTKNTDKFFHFKYWLTEDKELAEELKINTNPEQIGDIYLIRKSNHFNQRQKNVKICNYDFHCERILTSEDVSRDVQGSYARILQYAFNTPIVIHDYMTFANLTQKFKTNMLVVYCDQKEDPKRYNELLRTLIKARKALPINLKPDENGELQKSQRHQDVVFIMSSTKSLMPITKLHASEPQALFITPDSEYVDLLNNFLPKLEKVEGLSPDEFLKKALNIDQELKEDKLDENRKDTMKLIFSTDRFLMNKMYHTNDRETLSDFTKLVDFVKSSINGELKYYWDTETIPKTKYVQKVVGEDFDKRVMQGNKDALVLVYHPVKEKNRELINKYEEFVRTQDAEHGVSQDGQLVFAKYNGINESNTFKSPKNLPQILYFKKVKDQDEKEVEKLENIQDLLVRSADDQLIQKRLNDFIKKNRSL